MTYFGSWYPQARIYDVASIGGTGAAILVTLLEYTVKLVDKTQETLQLSSGIRSLSKLVDKSTILSQISSGIRSTILLTDKSQKTIKAKD